MRKYFDCGYDTKQRFVSYWHQVNEILKISAKRVMVIGVGNGLVVYYLRNSGINVSALDIEVDLKPDIVGNVKQLPVKEGVYDVALCCQTLEHLPYEYFSQCLGELYRITASCVILSLPDAGRMYPFCIRIPGAGYIKNIFRLPRIKKPTLQPGSLHYWEINWRNFPLHRICSDIKEAGFFIKDSYNVFENPFHRFFVLEKRKK